MNFNDNVYSFLSELNDFIYQIKSLDRIWNIIFLDKKGKWHHICVIKYLNTYYISAVDNDLCGLEVIPKKQVEAMASFGISSPFDGREDLPSSWGELITSARHWLKRTKKDWIKANKLVHNEYPLNRRYGIVSNSLIRSSLSKEIYRVDTVLGKRKAKKLTKLVENNYFHSEKNTERKEMTAKDYFDYCKIAYITGKRTDDHIDKSLTGRQMYERYADARHEGLLNIDENSKKEFELWIDGKHPRQPRGGGHPWEIKRGGNTTHIDLYVSRPSLSINEGYEVTVSGASIGRLAETISIFLGLVDAGLPVTISDPEGIRKRILAIDNIGIVPFPIGCFIESTRAFISTRAFTMSCIMMI